MNQYDSLNAKLSNSQLNKLKSAIKNWDYHQKWLVILMMNLIFYINYY